MPRRIFYSDPNIAKPNYDGPNYSHLPGNYYIMESEYNSEMRVKDSEISNLKAEKRNKEQEIRN